MLLQLVLAFAIALSASGITPSAFGLRPSAFFEPPVLATVEAVPAKPARAGAAMTLAVRVTPREGIHIYAPPQKDFKPISLTMGRTDAARIAKPQFPSAATRTFEGEPVKVYDAAFTITVPVVLARTARGPVALTGSVTYQACDDLICYRPVTVPVRWDIPLQ